MPLSKPLGPPPKTERPAENPIRELIQVFGLVERVMQPYFARFGISGAQWGVLRQLHRAAQEGRPGLRITELGERLLVRPPSVTGIVDRLERAGLVARDTDAADQRARRVRLTDRGRELLDAILAGHPAQIARLLGGLSAAEQAQLHQLLHKLGRHLEVIQP
jgi:DNA-binding MarR family transcriptional regulator